MLDKLAQKLHVQESPLCHYIHPQMHSSLPSRQQRQRSDCEASCVLLDSDPASLSLSFLGCRIVARFVLVVSNLGNKDLLLLPSKSFVVLPFHPQVSLNGK